MVRTDQFRIMRVGVCCTHVVSSSTRALVCDSSLCRVRNLVPDNIYIVPQHKTGPFLRWFGWQQIRSPRNKHSDHVGKKKQGEISGSVALGPRWDQNRHYSRLLHRNTAWSLANRKTNAPPLCRVLRQTLDSSFAIYQRVTCNKAEQNFCLSRSHFLGWFQAWKGQCNFESEFLFCHLDQISTLLAVKGQQYVFGCDRKASYPSLRYGVFTKHPKKCTRQGHTRGVSFIVQNCFGLTPHLWKQQKCLNNLVGFAVG